MTYTHPHWTPRRRSFLLATAGLGVLPLIPGCGGAGSSTGAYVRFSNATVDYASVDLSIAGSKVASALANGGTTSSWVQVAADDLQVSLAQAGSSTTRLSETHHFDQDSYTTVLAYGSLAQGMKLRYFAETTAAAGSGETKLRFFHATPALGAVDVYVTNADSLSGLSPTARLSAYEAISDFVTLASGSWRIRITGSGSTTDVLYDLTAKVTLGAKSAVTLAVVPRSSGSLPNLVAWAEQGDAVLLPNELA